MDIGFGVKDLFHFGQPDPETDPGGKNSPKIMKISTKANLKTRISYIFFEIIIILFNGLEYYLPHK